MPYKWDSPLEWLEEKAREWDAAQLYQELCGLARTMDSDALQDIFQSDMDRDGYFTKGEDDDASE